MVSYTLASQNNSKIVFNEDLVIKDNSNRVLCVLAVSEDWSDRRIELIDTRKNEVVTTLSYNGWTNLFGFSEVEIRGPESIKATVSKAWGKIYVKSDEYGGLTLEDNQDNELTFRVVSAKKGLLSVISKNPDKKIIIDPSRLADIEVSVEVSRFFFFGVALAFWIIPDNTPFP